MVCIRKQSKIKMEKSGGASTCEAFIKPMESQEGFSLSEVTQSDLSPEDITLALLIDITVVGRGMEA